MSKIIIFLFLAWNLYASAIEVSVFTPIVASEAITISADGVVVSKNTRFLSAKTTGILQLYVKNNSFVKKGTKIAYIMDKRRTQKLALLKQKLSIEMSEIKSQTLKLQNAKEMYKMGVGSKNSYLSQQLALQQIKELYESTKSSLKIVELEEKNAHIIASKSATIVNLLADNSYISYGTSLATLLRKNTLIKLFVDAKYIHQIKKGIEIKIDSAYESVDGIISEIIPRSSDNLIEVIATSKVKLPLNLRVRADIVLKNESGVFISKESIVLVDNHPAVYLIKDGVAHLMFIDILKDMIDKVLIKNSFERNSKIALKNAYMLHDNLEVIVK